MSGRMKQVENAIEGHLEAFMPRWGPIRWRELLDSTSKVEPDAVMGRMFWALSNIEDESVYMRTKIRWARADRLLPVADFNIMWLAEEAEHGRALAAMSRLFGYPSTRIKHNTFSRDKRSLLGGASVRIGSIYHAGMLGGYLTLGAMQEHTALTTYNAIGALDVPPQVTAVLREISRQEGRHMRFYRSSAAAVFDHFPEARPFVRAIVRRAWRPVGVDLLGLGRWKVIFLPYLNTEATRSKLAKVDEIAGELLRATTPVMQSFLARHAMMGTQPRLAEVRPQYGLLRSRVGIVGDADSRHPTV